MVLLTRWWNRNDFTLTGLDGQVIAQVREIPHPRVDDGMRAAFDFRNTVAPRYVIEVADPNGQTLFFIDAAERQTDASVPNGAGLARSTAIVRPEGRQWAREGGMFFDQVYADVMGDARFSLDENLYEWGRSSLIAGEDGVFPCAHACRVPLGKNRRLLYYTLLDADGTAFAQLDYAGGSPKVRRLVRFREKTPVAMRIAAIGSMIVLSAERRADVLPPDPKAPEPYPGFANIHLPHYQRLRAFMDKTIAEYQQ